MKKITPNIMVADVNATINYYEQNLEFEFVMGVNESKEVKMGDFGDSTLTWAMLKKDDVENMRVHVLVNGYGYDIINGIFFQPLNLKELLDA